MGTMQNAHTALALKSRWRFYKHLAKYPFAYSKGEKKENYMSGMTCELVNDDCMFIFSDLSL